MDCEKVLITGGLGFIGTHIAELLADEGRRLLLLDSLSPQIHGTEPDLSTRAVLRHAQVEIYVGDVRRPADWEEVLSDVGYVIHLAAETGTAQSMYEISRYTGTNVGGTGALLDYLANRPHGIRKLILASSRSVYGEGAYRCPQCGLVYPRMRTEEMLRREAWEPQCPDCGGRIQAVGTPEDAKPEPASIYAATKLAQEDLVRIATNALGIPAVIYRLQNVYGEGQSLRNPYTGVLSIFSNQLRLGKRLNLYEDGQESRDFVHVSDVARAFSLALSSDGADGATLNVGSGYGTSIERIALMLGKYFGREAQPAISGQYRLGDIRHGFADLAAIRARLGFAPEISLEDGLERFATWVEKQPVEPDLLDLATEELRVRGLMRERATPAGQGTGST